MSRFGLTSAICLFFACAVEARADLSSTPSRWATTSASAAWSPSHPTESPSGAAYAQSLLDGVSAVSHSIVPESANAAPEIVSIPPLPNSAAMFLSAVLSVGAWHVTRNAHQLHLCPLPDWYHSGAPEQIGHCVLFDFDFDGAPLRRFDRPACVRRPSLAQFERDDDHRRGKRWGFGKIAHPRGPPLLSF